MGQITRCPACGTMFKVVPDQLKISDGWVRCGHCAEVFDAQLNMQQSLSAAAPVLHKPSILHTQHQVASLTPEPEPEPEPRAVLEQGSMDIQGDARNGDAALDGSDMTEQLATYSDPVQNAFNTVPVTNTARQIDPQQEPHDWHATETVGISATADVVRESVVNPSFMRTSSGRLFWRRPSVRWGLRLLSVLLALTLSLQLLRAHRDWLVAAYPEVREALEALCRLSACTIEPLRQIEALVIDGSSFNRVLPNVYRLSFTLKNTAGLDVAMPAIELTLTDVRERTLLRRVLTPDEFGAAAVSVKAGREWTGAVTLEITGAAAGVSGYHILAFYP